MSVECLLSMTLLPGRAVDVFGDVALDCHKVGRGRCGLNGNFFTSTLGISQLVVSDFLRGSNPSLKRLVTPGVSD
jgi:hypothetical protein